MSKPYPTVGDWADCVRFSPDPTSHSVTCTLSTSITTSVNGTVTVSLGDISAAVGYSASKTYGVSGGETYTVPGNRAGTVQWAATFTTNTVTQTEYLCLIHGGSCQETGNKATAYTHQYLAPTFRIIYN
ncbi:hypothetical protein [Pseudonocardia acidicola]|uniref:hypothetical protein n=1 Tax=Pseudonocardia acidicola TaxID=2724939 RepID=UPI001B7D098F|nr:hypothetical protein [Pseudonocardia acidicola]